MTDMDELHERIIKFRCGKLRGQELTSVTTMSLVNELWKVVQKAYKEGYDRASKDRD